LYITIHTPYNRTKLFSTLGLNSSSWPFFAIWIRRTDAFESGIEYQRFGQHNLKQVGIEGHGKMDFYLIDGDWSMDQQINEKINPGSSINLMLPKGFYRISFCLLSTSGGEVILNSNITFDTNNPPQPNKWIEFFPKIEE
jgi:hypothetical protein